MMTKLALEALGFVVSTTFSWLLQQSFATLSRDKTPEEEKTLLVKVACIIIAFLLITWMVVTFFSIWSNKLQDVFFQTIVQFGTIFCTRLFITSNLVPVYVLFTISLLVGISQRKKINGIKISSALAFISGLIPTCFLIIEYLLHFSMLITGWIGILYLLYNLYRNSTWESRVKHFFAIFSAALVSIVLMYFDAYDTKNQYVSSYARYLSTFWKVALLLMIFGIVLRYVQLMNHSVYQQLYDTMHEVFMRFQTLF